MIYPSRWVSPGEARNRVLMAFAVGLALGFFVVLACLHWTVELGWAGQVCGP